MKLSHFFPASLASLFPMRKSNLTPSLLQLQGGQGGLWGAVILPMVAVTRLCSAGQTHTVCSAWGSSHPAVHGAELVTHYSSVTPQNGAGSKAVIQWHQDRANLGGKR